MHPEAQVNGSRRFPRLIWQGGQPLYAIPELARRWRISPQAVRQWGRRHPELTARVGCHTYIIDRRT